MATAKMSGHEAVSGVSSSSKESAAACINKRGDRHASIIRSISNI